MIENRYKYHIEYGPIKDLMNLKLKTIIIDCYIKNSKEIKKLLFGLLNKTIVSSKIYYKKYEDIELLDNFKILNIEVKSSDLDTNADDFLYNKYGVYE